MKAGKVVLVLTSPLKPGEEKINGYLTRHGDSIYDVAFAVDDARALYHHALAHGAKAFKTA